MKKVGLTGGIGSGKTFISKIFEALGVPVFNSDLEAKKISNLPEIKFEILKQFPTVKNKNEVDRKKLAEIVFKDPEKLKLLNKIIHPKVGEVFENWCNQKEVEKTPYIIKESAILFETGIYKNLDKTILVHAPQKIRVRRILLRNPELTKEMILERMKKQWEDIYKTNLADFQINNSGNEPLLPQIEKIHSELSI